jgi:hypothetical protein
MDRKCSIYLRPFEFFTRPNRDLSELTFTRANLTLSTQSTISENGDCTNNDVLLPNEMYLGPSEVTIISLTCTSQDCHNLPHCRFGNWAKDPEAVMADPTGMAHLT